MHRHDHLQGGAPVLAAGAFPHRAVLLDRPDQLPRDDQIALVSALAGGEAFPLVQQHPLPASVLLARDPQALPVDVHLPPGRVAQGDDALGAVDLEPEPEVVESSRGIAAIGFVVRRHPVLEGVVGRHPVAGDGADALVSLAHVFQGHLPSSLGDVPMGPCHVGPGEVAHAVHHVGAQDHKVLRPGPVVGLAVAAQHLQAADGPFVHQLLAVLLVGIGAPMGNRGLDSVGPAGLQQGVRLPQGGSQRFLDQQAPRPGLGAGDDHLGVAVRQPRADADQVQVLGGEHAAVIGVEPPRPGALAGRGAALGVGIGNGHEVHLLQPLEGHLQQMAVVAAPGVSDGAGTIALAHG